MHNDLFYHSFTQVCGKLSFFFHYVDFKYEDNLSHDLIGPIMPNDLFYRSFTQVRGKLSLFIH